MINNEITEKKQNILVIDDSKLNRQIVKKTFATYNYNVTEAVDGLDGLEKIRNNDFDIILLDIIMPNLDGFGFLEKFKSEIKKFIPIILMTGLDDLNSKIQGLNTGADDFLMKPLHEKELVARVFSLLRLKEAHDGLQKTLNDVEELKKQQDGDYFLTSLLIDPLNTNLGNNDSIKTEFLIKQKKKFQFKKWQKEIGGDICISKNITLKNKEYTAIINADAMGKSMQGAGGAIVLGTAFGSIVNEKEIINKLPEIWIRDIVKNFQDIFESFNGSMMISMVIILIDNSNGCMYHINAEHPFPVIYREGRAEFLEKNIQLRKIGWLGMNKKINVKIFQMQKDDVIILGSDGRDDLLLGNGINGNRIINEDETLFLEVVKDSNADLNDIYTNLIKKGSLTDDLSLVKISYNNQNYSLKDEILDTILNLAEQKNINTDDDISNIFNNLFKKYIKEQNYSEIEKLLERYYGAFPEDNNSLFLYSYLNKIEKKYNEAIEYGEALFLRDDNHINNLVNLANLYNIKKDKRKAAKIIDHLKSIDPDNKNLQLLSK